LLAIVEQPISGARPEKNGAAANHLIGQHLDKSASRDLNLRVGLSLAFYKPKVNILHSRAMIYA
jgi:hypothetical protein